MENLGKFLAYEGMVKVTCVDSTEVLKKAMLEHKLSKTVAVAFGRLLTMGNIIGADLKNDNDNVTLQIKGNGAAGKMLVVAKRGAKVKGYVENGEAEVEPNENGKLNVRDIVGTEGYIYIIKDLGLKEPYVGISEIVTGEIAEDFANYYAKSEQVPTALSLGVLFDENGELLASGGFILQLMPDATEEVIEKVESGLKDINSVTDLIAKGERLSDIVRKITGDQDILEMLGEIHAEYICDCSRERMLEGLATLGQKDINEIFESKDEIEVECHFCSKKYSFNANDIQNVLNS